MTNGTAMDFGALPPEVISGQMYSGPGSGPMLAAAAAWDGLAAELQDTATSYGAVVSGLATGAWTGPSSKAMTAAVIPFVTWISTAAAQAREAATQARAAAGAYEAAFAATVPPPAIAANRGQLALLSATNVFGQNTAAIAAIEAQYRQMWAQDVAAMYNYAGASAAATRLTPFGAPPHTADGSGQAGQDAAVAHAAASVAGTAAQSLIPNFLDDLAAGSTRGTTAMAGLLNGMTGSSSAAPMYEHLFSSIASVTKFSTVSNDSMSLPNLGMVQFKTFFKPLPMLPDIPKSALGAGLGGHGLPPLNAGMVSQVSAAAGEAPVVGPLSVPPGWATATPAIRLAANTLPAASMAAAPVAGIAGGTLGSAALGSLVGGALGGSAPRIVGGAGVRGRSGARDSGSTPVRLDRVIARLQRDDAAVQHWQVDEEGLDDLLAELSKKPGVHAVHLSGDGPTRTATATSSG